jgi:hypothetical protein
MNPVLVSTWGPTPKKYLGAFLDTAKRQGLNPQNFDDTDWPGSDWTTIPWYRKSEGQARFVREHASEYSHFMFTDSYDVVFAAGWREIMEKYERFDSPIVFASECCPWPNAKQAVFYPETKHRCKYLNAGFWMATTEAAIDLLTEIETVASKREQCDQGICVDAFLSRRHPIKLDTACSLCFCCNLDSLSFLDLSRDRPITKDTGEQPVMFHGNGASPLQGIIECLNKPKLYMPTEEERARMSE